MYWWSHPSRLTLFLLIPIFLGAASLGYDEFRIFDHPANYIRGDTFWVGLVGLLAFAACSFAMEFIPARYNPYPEVAPQQLQKVIHALFYITFFAYVLFLLPAFISPSLLIGLITGEVNQYQLRELLNRIPGITSFMALQSLFIVCAMLYPHLTGYALPGRIKKMVVIIFVFCVLRAWLWSERLALIELVLPIIIIKVATFHGRHRRWLVVAPVLGIIGLFLLFSLGEYFRSWQFRQGTTNLTFWEYMIARLAGYYATAINNGAAFIQNREPYYFPINTAQWFHKFPLWSLLDIKTVNDSFSAQDFLETYANPEFNNTSGLYMPYLDFGTILGTFCWAVLGLISGWLMRLYRNKSLGGLIFYPLWFIGITEILRIFYWGNQRFFPVIVAAYIVVSYLRPQRYFVIIDRQ